MAINEEIKGKEENCKQLFIAPVTNVMFVSNFYKADGFKS